MESTPHPAGLTADQLADSCDIKRTRRGGPGGQHRNKVDSAIVVTHRDTGVTAQASERRSQHENREVALNRLRVNLAIEVRMPRNAGPSKLWQSRCSSGRIGVSTKHDDFPSILAEALDQIFAHELQIAAAAETLGCSTSQLIKLTKQEPAAFTMLNDARKSNDMSLLR